MTFACPACNAPALEIVAYLELPPALSPGSDELTLQLVRCGSCAFVGGAVYEESRRGASDLVHHDGFVLPPAAFSRLETLLAACPAPAEPWCPCPGHALVAGRGRSYRRVPPFRDPASPTFPMRLV